MSSKVLDLSVPSWLYPNVHLSSVTDSAHFELCGLGVVLTWLAAVARLRPE